jgi:hypothetical protein
LCLDRSVPQRLPDFGSRTGEERGRLGERSSVVDFCPLNLSPSTFYPFPSMHEFLRSPPLSASASTRSLPIASLLRNNGGSCQLVFQSVRVVSGLRENFETSRNKSQRDELGTAKRWRVIGLSDWIVRLESWLKTNLDRTLAVSMGK